MLLAKAWLDPLDSDALKVEGNPGEVGVNEVTRDVADTDAVPRDEFTLGVDVVGKTGAGAEDSIPEALTPVLKRWKSIGEPSLSTKGSSSG
jgi:hypothetical protein